MKVFWDPDCLLHDPPYEILSGDKQPYFESPARLLLIKNELEANPSLFSLESASSSSQNPGLDIIRYVEMVHGREYLDYLRNAYDNWVRSGGSTVAVIPETFPHPKLLPVTVSRETDVRRSGIRPPGHHAGTSLCGGYCFVNNVAVAARFLQCSSLGPAETEPEPPERLRIAILDIDYHHGNGTQQIFYADRSVHYASLHAVDDYPYYTGEATENGTGEGTGTNFNYPLPRGTQDDDYCTALKTAIVNIRNFNPAYLLVSLGVDTFVDDPIGDFKLSQACYAVIGQTIANLGKPTLFIMEGGYHMETLGGNVRAVLEGFERGRGNASV
ncbi:hypothetical protein BC827DRAFT_1258004 [Russula dissimulans]|nr:hypothetical protein BC827DRAFT_1258004 [Russula dissimulans]